MPWGSMGSFAFVLFIQVRPGDRRVPSGSFGSFGSALSVVVFIRVRLVHCSTPWVLLGSFGFVRYIRNASWW